MDEPTPQSHYLNLEYHDGVTVIHFVDIQIAPDVKDFLYDLVENEGHTRLLLNFSNITALSTQALGVLATFQKKVQAAGGHVRLCCLNPDVTKLFHLTKFDSIFEIDASQEEAMRHLGGAPA